MKIGSVFCPECEHPVKVGAHPFKGQPVKCTECGAHLTIANLNPLEVEVSTELKQLAAKNKVRLVEIACPECDSLIKLKPRLREGESLICPECQTALEVVGVDPLELDVALPVNIRSVRQKQNPAHKSGKHKS